MENSSKLTFAVMVRYPKDRIEDDPNGFGAKVVTASSSMTTISNTFTPMIYDLVGNAASARLYAFDLSGDLQMGFVLWDEECNVTIEDAESRFEPWLSLMQQYEPVQANLITSFLLDVKNAYNARIIDDNASDTWDEVKEVIAERCKDAADYTALIAILENERAKLGASEEE